MYQYPPPPTIAAPMSVPIGFFSDDVDGVATAAATGAPSGFPAACVSAGACSVTGCCAAGCVDAGSAGGGFAGGGFALVVPVGALLHSG
jgi:hypothetical protein